MRLKVHLLFPLIFMSACSGEVFGPDSDADGLSDTQEAVFCTDPYNADTDADTIPDADDPSPCDAPVIKIQGTIVSTTSSTELSTHHIRISTMNDRGALIDNVRVQISTTFGTIENEQQPATGVYTFDAVSREDGLGLVTVTASYPNASGQPTIFTLPVTFALANDTPGHTQHPDPPATPLLSETHVELERPGINPGKYANAGPLDGDIWIMTIDGSSLDWSGRSPKPSAHAYVQIDFDDGSTLTAQTNDSGWIHITDDRLRGPVTLTVGAKGARYVTYADLNARVVSVGIHARDIPAAEAQTRAGTVKGVVRGFCGEAGVPAFPSENTNIFGKFNIAIVQIAFRNTPLSSMNTGAILLPPDADASMASYFAIPPNLVLANLSQPEHSTFRLTGVAPGEYIVFALAGVGSNILEASQNPYRLVFEPRALGMTTVKVEAGKTPEVQINLDIDLTQGADTNDIYFGDLPMDPETGKPLETGLLLPMINTGKGFIFLDVNGAYNFDSFSNPLRASFPRATHKVFQTLGLEAEPIVVGLAGRAAVSGFDLPGISTIIRHVTPGTPLSMYGKDAWLDMPTASSPAKPVSDALDAVETTLDAPMAWTVPDKTDLTIIRLNYMTPPIHNKILDSDIGSSRAHLLWEIYVPSPNRSLALPRLSPEAPDYPVLVNYEPTTPEAAYQYDAETIEFEINAYVMGPNPFDYNVNFMATDVNLNAAIVSQDSWLFRYPSQK